MLLSTNTILWPLNFSLDRKKGISVHFAQSEELNILYFGKHV